MVNKNLKDGIGYNIFVVQYKIAKKILYKWNGREADHVIKFF